ncbi:Hint domain-containing protein [Blastochloris tepida]|uniref:Hedgehog/Intein (Hint) domain-containing protein n=1 Tax=Blastochloris tepida TaxID=2233851 RepID=A0A348G2K3_9HYPH|nr:Hint domain-containing protein [Blastochloris tepida]BBF93786.1 hypothetical protein BLTE_24710 [Blastochloris tepida]
MPSPILGTSDDDVLDGTSGDDIIYGKAGDDTLTGGAGADELRGGRGDDTVSGGAGEDIIYGGDGDDSIDGGRGDDEISGGTGDDTIDGGLGSDVIHGGAGDDTVDGGRGDDEIYGGTGDDRISGGAGSDLLSGGAGDDTIDGGRGDDEIHGGAGDDRIDGGRGDDEIYGGAGDDVITGGKGDDFIKGGAGEDTVVFAGNRDDYTIVAESDGTFSITNRITGETDTVDFDVENARFDDGTVTICFMPGTMIRTPAGEAAVETLQAGDLVLTREGAAQPVRWIGRQTVSTRFGDPLRVLPIRIRAGALGDNVPTRDLLISPDHAILVDGALIHAGALVNGTSIVRERDVPEVFTYYHVELDDHSLVLAENTPAETFVDNVERLNFDNWDEYQALYPEGKTITELPYPRAKAHRQVPVALRVQLAARAQAIGAAVEKAVA